MALTLATADKSPAASARELFTVHGVFEALADAAGYKVSALGLTAVDGSALRALPQIVAAVGSERDAKWRRHLQFEVHRELPEHATLTPDETGGDDDRWWNGGQCPPDRKCSTRLFVQSWAAVLCRATTPQA